MAKYIAIKDNDIDNGPGLRVSVWFSGCPHKCNGCHNPETWDETQGVDFDSVAIDNVINLLNKYGLTQGLSILGGEPLAPYNISATARLVTQAKLMYPNLNIWLWTGYDVTHLLHEDRYYYEARTILDNVDVIVDGKYIKHLHEEHPYKGSSNQRVIDNKASMKIGKYVFYTE
jgi:anaerobic ribonucleoside-triphosphate reductase activating protein